MKKLDRIVLIVLALVLGLILLIVTLGDRVGVQVSAVIPAEGESVGIYGPLGLQFDQPMDHASVEDHFSINPSISGKFTWVGDTLWFYPETPLDPTQDVTITLASGAESTQGRQLIDPWQSTFTVRSPDILYFVLAEKGGDLWRWDFSTQAAIPLTDTGGAVIDFAPNRTGEAIVYAAENAKGGSDLWVTDRDGTQSSLVVDCGSDYCSQLTWSADGPLIAYAHQNTNDTSGQLQSPRIWLYDNETQETAPLYTGEDIPGELPSFSPNGEWLAFYDIGQDGIRVLNLANNQETLIPTDVEGMGDWSPDGSQLLFTDQIPSALEPEVALYGADLESQTITRALAEDSDGTSFSQPRYSPDSNWIAVSLRPVNSTGNRALWVLKLDGSEIKLITNQQNATYTSYQWSPSGLHLVYQRLDTGNSAFQSSIWLWSWSMDESQMLIENGSRPVWIP